MRETKILEFKESLDSNTFLKTNNVFANYQKLLISDVMKSWIEKRL